MRPRVFPAEDATPATFTRSRTTSFNEAAGIPRGRRAMERRPDRRDDASMRPRVFPAEDAQASGGRRSGIPGFNEAAGIPRGRQTIPFQIHGSADRFNEAAGIPRGRRGRGDDEEQQGGKLQ